MILVFFFSETKIYKLSNGDIFNIFFALFTVLAYFTRDSTYITNFYSSTILKSCYSQYYMGFSSRYSMLKGYLRKIFHKANTF